MIVCSKAVSLVLCVCLFQSFFSFSCFGFDEKEGGNKVGSASNSSQNETEQRKPLTGYNGSSFYRDILNARFAERDYNYNHNPEFVGWMRNEEYEKVKAYLEDQSKTDFEALGLLWNDNDDPFWPYLGFKLGEELALLSDVLEYSGNLRESRNIQGVFVSQTEALCLDWQNARYEYSHGNFKSAFKQVYLAVLKIYIFWNIDAVLDREEAGQYFPLYSRECILAGLELQEIYRLKDECVRVVCPDFHWKYNDFWGDESPKNRAALINRYKDCFKEFIQFIEEQYSLLISIEESDDPEIDVESLRQYYKSMYGPMVEQFRKLAQYPD